MKKTKFLFIIFMISILLFGCNKDKTETEFKQKDKAPASLGKLTKNLDDILNSVSEIERINLNIPTKTEEKENKQPEKTSSSSGESGGGDNTQGQGQGGQGQGGNQQGATGGAQTAKKPETKEDKLKKQWDSIEKKLEDAHINWNNYEAEGLKKGATKENGDKFEAAFNKLTTGVANKNIIEIYDYASQSYSNLKPFYDLYKDEMGGDIAVLKYAAYQAYVKAIEGEIDKAETILNGREENVNKIRLKTTKEDEKEKVEKLALSLTDFRDALKENNRRLFMIKKDVIIEGINEIKE